MPKGNGDNRRIYTVKCFCLCQEHGECRKAMETRGIPPLNQGRRRRQEHGECRKAMETRRYGCSRRRSSPRQEHGECRKAMETCAMVYIVSGTVEVRNTVNAERQWRHCFKPDVLVFIVAGQEHGECRKAMETLL